NLLYGGDEPGAAFDRITESRQLLEKAGEIDPRLQPLAEMLGEAAAQVEEASRELRLYREKIEFDPARLAMIEERLDEIYKLKRKYGKSIAEILEYAEKTRQELAMIEGEEERMAALTRELAEIEEELAAAALELSALRKEAAAGLEKTVLTHL